METIAKIPRHYVLQTFVGILTITLLMVSSSSRYSLEASSEPWPKFTDVRFVTLDVNSKPINGAKKFHVSLSETGTLFN